MLSYHLSAGPTVVCSWLHASEEERGTVVGVAFLKAPAETNTTNQFVPIHPNSCY